MTWKLTRGQTDVNNNRSLWEPSATCLAPSWEARVFLYVLTTMIGDITSSGLRLRKPRHREVQTLTQEEWEIRGGGWRGPRSRGGVHVSEQGSWRLAVAAESQWPFPRRLHWLLLLLVFPGPPDIATIIRPLPDHLLYVGHLAKAWAPVETGAYRRKGTSRGRYEETMAGAVPWDFRDASSSVKLFLPSTLATCNHLFICGLCPH